MTDASLLRRIYAMLVIAIIGVTSNVVSAQMPTPEDIVNAQLKKVKALSEPLKKNLVAEIDDDRRFDILDRLAKLYTDQPEEISYTLEKIEIAKHNHRKDDLLRCYLDLCRNYCEQDELEMVRHWAKRVQDEAANEPHYWVAARYFVIETLLWQQDVRQAWNEVQTLKLDVSRVDDKKAMATVNLLTAEIFSYSDMEDQSWNMVSQFLPLLSKSDECQQLFSCYITAIESALYTGRLNEALTMTRNWEKQFNSVKSAKQNLVDKTDWALRLVELSYYVYAGNRTKAAETLNEVWDNCYVPSKWSMMQFLYLRAGVNTMLGNEQDAVADINYLLQHSDHDHNNYYRLLGMVYQRAGDYKNASDALKSSVEELTKVMHSNMQRELEQYDAQASQFNKENEQAIARQNNQKMLNIGMVCIMALILMGSIYLIVGFMRNRRTSAKLTEVNATLKVKKNELSMVNGRYQTAIQEAEESNRKKNEFLANISHEIRTPLNSIVGFSEVLADSFSDDDEAKEYVRLIRHNSDTLLDLVGQTITDKNDGTNGGLELARVNVVDVVRNTVRSFEPNVKQGVKLSLVCSSDPIEIVTDKHRINQIMSNLIGNACKFTSKGSITVQIIDCGTTVKFVVADTGEGIPPENRDQIFNKFAKASEQSHGHGLGLFICRTVSEQLRGKIYLDKGYNKGARFVFEHPAVWVSVAEGKEDKK